MTIKVETKDPNPVKLLPNKYVKVATSSCPAGGEVHIMGYTNLQLKLAQETGRLRIKAVRRDNNDSTSYDDRTVKADNDNLDCNWLITQVWFGGRPPGGVFDWYVKIGRHIVSGEANAGDEDYGKAMNN